MPGVVQIAYVISVRLHIFECTNFINRQNFVRMQSSKLLLLIENHTSGKIM